MRRRMLDASWKSGPFRAALGLKIMRAYRVCVRTAFSIRAVGQAGRICAPEGRLRIARRFQRRVKWNTERVPEGRLKVLTHTL